MDAQPSSTTAEEAAATIADEADVDVDVDVAAQPTTPVAADEAPALTMDEYYALPQAERLDVLRAKLARL